MTESEKKSFFRRLLSWIPLKRFRDPAPVVALIRLQGVIGRTSVIGPGGLTLNGVEKIIARAFDQKKLSAVALAVNSPGGSPVQSALIADRIRQLADEKDVPVMAFVEDVAASGGYWLACAADEIFADRNSIIGSIGVIYTGFGFPEAIDRLGIERRIYTAGDSKSMLDPFQPEDPEDIKRIKVLQADIYNNFKQMVRDRRGERLQGDDKTLFNGDVWTGGQALEFGLIDGIGDSRSVLRERFGEKVNIKPVSIRTNPLKKFLAGGSSSMARDHVAAGLEVLEEWSSWKRYGL